MSTFYESHFLKRGPKNMTPPHQPQEECGSAALEALEPQNRQKPTLAREKLRNEGANLQFWIVDECWYGRIAEFWEG